MAEETRLQAARRARDAAVTAKEHALAALKNASIRTRAALETRKEPLAELAGSVGVSPPVISRLKPAKDGSWTAMDPSSYRAIDKLTKGEFGLEELRKAYNAAVKRVKEAELDLHLAEVEADTVPQSRTNVVAPDETTALVVDDVLIDRRHNSVVLDVRVRNGGHQTVNITRVAVRILERKAFLAVCPSSADYDLLVDGDYSETNVAHYVKPDDVDRFTVTLGFVPAEVGHVFTSEVVVLFNRDHAAVSKPVTFDSCFE